MKRTELKRKTGLKRGGHNLKRKTAMKDALPDKPIRDHPLVIKGQGPNHRKGIAAELERKMFRERARQQKVCQVPGCPEPTSGDWNAHHILYEAELKRMKTQTHNVRNAMRVCRRCHERHHNRTAPIPLSALTEDQVAYVTEVLGARGMDYLERLYAT